MSEAPITPDASTEAGTGASHADRRHELLLAGLDLLDQGMTVIDGDLRMVAWNQAFLELLEFPEAMAYVGAPFESFMHYNAERGEYGPGNVEELVAERMRLARAFKPHYTERDRPNGRTLAVRGEPLPHNGFVTLYTDITERRRYERVIKEQNAELERRVAQRTEELHSRNQQLRAASEANQHIAAALRRSEERLRLITDSVPALIGYFDRDQVYRYVNKGYADWFGFGDKESILGKNIREVAGDAVYADVGPHVARALEGKRVSYEYSMRRPDGQLVHARSELVPEIGPDGLELGCFVLSVDITELKEVQDALVHAKKMEAMGQLTGGLAHDFNNMLAVIIGNLATLRSRRLDSAETREFVVPALKAAEHGAALIKRLLAFARKQPLEARPVAVGELVADTVILLKRTLPENITLSVNAGTQPLHAMTDPHQLEDALLNLALNARDAMPQGGRLHIEAGALHLAAAEAAEHELGPGSYIGLSVSDTGSGMDAATLSRAFEPFFTTKRFGSGSGLGLSMVYGFAKQSGGGIRIRSTPGVGTLVSLVLPRCTEGPATEPAPSATSAGAEGDRARPLVLLVEDDAEVRRVIRLQLVQLGYPVIEADHGADALDILATVASVGILISDVVMPGGIDGRTLCHSVAQAYPRVRRMLISGYVADEAAPGDGTRLLRKPFTNDELESTLRSLEA